MKVARRKIVKSEVLTRSKSLTEYRIGNDDLDRVYEILREAKAPQSRIDEEILKKLMEKDIQYELTQVQSLSLKDKELLGQCLDRIDQVDELKRKIAVNKVD